MDRLTFFLLLENSKILRQKIARPQSCTTKQECGPGGEQSSAAAAAASRALPQQPRWISLDSAAKCIDLHAIVPDKIPMISTGKVSEREAEMCVRGNFVRHAN